jgi:hypothetical protein
MSGNYHNQNRICPQCSTDSGHNYSNYCQSCGSSLNIENNPSTTPDSSKLPPSVRPTSPVIPTRNPNFVRGRIEHITERFIERKGSLAILLSLIITTIILAFFLAIVWQVTQSPQLMTQTIILLLPIALIWFCLSFFLRLLGSNTEFSIFNSLPNLFTFIGGIFNLSRFIFDRQKADIRLISIQLITDRDERFNVEIRGDILGGFPQVGNTIEIHGSNKRGTIEFRSGENISTRAKIRVRRP